MKRKNIKPITLFDSDGHSLSFDHALAALVKLLMNAPLQTLAQTLAEISSILYEKPSEEAEKKLRAKFCSEQTVAYICPENDTETTHFLFHPNALYILNSLLTFNIKLNAREQFDVHLFHISNGIHRPIGNFVEHNRELRIPEIFLLTNQLIIHLEENLEKIPLYYSKRRVQEDVYTAISKAKNLYDTDYFNLQLLQRLGYTVSQLSTYQFILLTAVKTRSPAKLELDSSFNKIKDSSNRKYVTNLLNLLSIEAKNTDVTLNEAAQALRNDFVLDNLSRGKPFLKIDQRYICIRQDLLIATIDNFPYRYLLNVLLEEEKATLFREFGSAFEQKYIPTISQSIIGKLIDTYKYTKKPHRGGNPGDLCLSVTNQSKLILEIKSSRENDNVKSGATQDLIDKYIHLKGSKEKRKGILQAVNDAKKLRQDLFSGEIFTGIIFYSLPKEITFDKLVEQEIYPTEEYQEYLRNPSNLPPIWLDVQTYELLLSAVQQGACLYDLLKKIAGLPPSQIRRGIIEFMNETDLTISISSLYIQEVHALQEHSKAMLLPDEDLQLESGAKTVQ